MAASDTSTRETSPTSVHSWLNVSQEGRLQRRALTVLFYLCGDQPGMEHKLKERADELRNVCLENISVAVQWDRCVVESAPPEPLTAAGKKTPETQHETQHETETIRFVVGDGRVHFERTVGPTNTGDPEVAKGFMEWGIDRCPSDQLAVVIAGTGIGEPHSIVGNVDADTESDYQRIFSFCDDVTGHDALNPDELREILEHIVSRRNKPIDLIAFDMCSMQFLEIAYQLDGLANVLIGPQNNDQAPEWPYEKILKGWDEKIHLHQEQARSSAKVSIENLSTQLARSTVQIVGAKYAESPLQPMISAVNLSHLEQVTRAVDTLFVSLLLSLGDDVVWRVRKEVFEDLKAGYKKLIGRDDVGAL